MIAYVVGLLLDNTGRALLIEKRQGPAAVIGRLNGPGGKVEPGEAYPQAVAREVREETGIDTSPDLWRLLTVLRTRDGADVAFLTARVRPAILDAAHTCEDEPVTVLSARELLHRAPDRLVPNLTWLLPLAAYDHDTYLPLVACETPKPETMETAR